MQHFLTPFNVFEKRKNCNQLMPIFKLILWCQPVIGWLWASDDLGTFLNCNPYNITFETNMKSALHHLNAWFSRSPRLKSDGRLSNDKKQMRSKTKLTQHILKSKLSWFYVKVAYKTRHLRFHGHSRIFNIQVSEVAGDITLWSLDWNIRISVSVLL